MYFLYGPVRQAQTPYQLLFKNVSIQGPSDHRLSYGGFVYLETIPYYLSSEAEIIFKGGMTILCAFISYQRCLTKCAGVEKNCIRIDIEFCNVFPYDISRGVEGLVVAVILVDLYWGILFVMFI